MSRMLFYLGAPPNGTPVGHCHLRPRLSPNGTPLAERNLVYICPQCGIAWGHRTNAHPSTIVDGRYLPRLRPCTTHGGGNFFQPVPLGSERDMDITTATQPLLEYSLTHLPEPRT